MDAAPVTALFGADAELHNLVKAEPAPEQQSALDFWQSYLAMFQQIRSDFTNVIEADQTAVLEWTSEGILHTGEPIRYRGVSIVEGAGDQVLRFRTYYDSAAFVPGGAKHQPASTASLSRNTGG
jgi:hypothetical protein